MKTNAVSRLIVPSSVHTSIGACKESKPPHKPQVARAVGPLRLLSQPTPLACSVGLLCRPALLACFIGLLRSRRLSHLLARGCKWLLMALTISTILVLSSNIFRVISSAISGISLPAAVIRCSRPSIFELSFFCTLCRPYRAHIVHIHFVT